jgi:hypothetical protein
MRSKSAASLSGVGLSKMDVSMAPGSRTPFGAAADAGMFDTVELTFDRSGSASATGGSSMLGRTGGRTAASMGAMRSKAKPRGASAGGNNPLDALQLTAPAVSPHGAEWKLGGRWGRVAGETCASCCRERAAYSTDR